MPGRRCVVQDCGNVKNDELGISIHNSPDSGSVRLKWKRFVSIHRKDFNPTSSFVSVLLLVLLFQTQTFCITDRYLVNRRKFLQKL